MSELVERIAELEREVAEARERIAALEVERRLPRFIERPARVPGPFESTIDSNVSWPPDSTSNTARLQGDEQWSYTGVEAL